MTFHYEIFVVFVAFSFVFSLQGRHPATFISVNPQSSSAEIVASLYLRQYEGVNGHPHTLLELGVTSLYCNCTVLMLDVIGMFSWEEEGNDGITGVMSAAARKVGFFKNPLK